MTRPIGYYVHHHGDGHRQRALAIAPHFGKRIVLLGTGIAGRTRGLPTIDLPDDRLSCDGFTGRDDARDRPESLHYAPLDHDGVRRRAMLVTGWIAEARPALMIVDVSIEIAMLARLASVPTVPMRLSGIRDDAPHRQAFAAAQAVICPFHERLDDPATPEWLRCKTLYAPGLTPRAIAVPIDPTLVLVVLGRGGGESDGALWAAAARAVPDRRWRVIGVCDSPADRPGNLDIAGWVANPEREIASAAIVIGAAGDGTVGAVLAAGRPFVCLPEDRPFEEQRSKARALAAAGVAIVCDAMPPPEDWRVILNAAARLSPSAAARLDDPDGARKLADRLRTIADRLAERCAA